MLKVKALESPLTKMGTNEKELKYVLKPVYSGTVAEKEIIDFCQTLTQLPRTYLYTCIVGKYYPNINTLSNVGI